MYLKLANGVLKQVRYMKNVPSYKLSSLDGKYLLPYFLWSRKEVLKMVLFSTYLVGRLPSNGRYVIPAVVW